MSTPEPSVADAVSKTNEAANHIIAIKAEEPPKNKNVHIEPGYVKIDGIRHLDKNDIDKMIKSVGKAVAKQTNDQSYIDFFLIINIPYTKIMRARYGFAWVLIKENNPGNRVFNVLVGKNPDGTENIPDKSNPDVKKQFVQIKPLRMNREQTEKEWISIQQKYSTDLENPQFKIFKRSYEDYVIGSLIGDSYDEATKVTDEDKLMEALKKYADLLDKRVEEDESEEDHIEMLNILNSDNFTNEDVTLIKNHLTKQSEAINQCNLFIEPAHVEDLEPGFFPYHLMTTELTRPEITADLLRNYFLPYNTVDGIHTRTYPTALTEISGQYPHVWIQEIQVGRAKKRYGHIAFSDDPTNYNGQYALHMTRKLDIHFRDATTQRPGIHETVINFFNEKYNPEKLAKNLRPERSLPSRTTLGSYANTGTRTQFIRKPTTSDMIVDINSGQEFPTPAGVKTKNPFAALAGKIKSSESVWAQPLPQTIKQGNENTLYLNTEITNMPSGPLIFVPRKYNMERDYYLRDDGNLTRFF
jgi:hypothetical protein